jgi:hypothetical protein
MLCTINDVYLADETISGGFALTGLRIKMERIAEIVVELAALNPVIMDRNKRRVDISFSISRIHDTIADAETYILDHDSTIPRTGDVKLITMGTETVIALIVNGALVRHELTRQYGKYTEHAYRITGSPIFAPTPGEDYLVTEGGDRITTEAGEPLIVE